MQHPTQAGEGAVDGPGLHAAPEAKSMPKKRPEKKKPEQKPENEISYDEDACKGGRGDKGSSKGGKGSKSRPRLAQPPAGSTKEFRSIPY